MNFFPDSKFFGRKIVWWMRPPFEGLIQSFSESSRCQRAFSRNSSQERKKRFRVCWNFVSKFFQFAACQQQIPEIWQVWWESRLTVICIFRVKSKHIFAQRNPVVACVEKADVLSALFLFFLKEKKANYSSRRDSKDFSADAGQGGAEPWWTLKIEGFEKERIFQVFYIYSLELGTDPSQEITKTAVSRY